MASGFARFVRKIKGAAYTDLQNAVREATSNDPATPPDKLVWSIINASNSNTSGNFAEISEILYRRLTDPNHPRHVYKAFNLLFHLLSHSKNKQAFQRNAKSRIKTIARYRKYHPHEEGLSYEIRNAAMVIYDMVMKGWKPYAESKQEEAAKAEREGEGADDDRGEGEGEGEGAAAPAAPAAAAAPASSSSKHKKKHKKKKKGKKKKLIHLHKHPSKKAIPTSPSSKKARTDADKLDEFFSDPISSNSNPFEAAAEGVDPFKDQQGHHAIFDAVNEEHSDGNPFEDSEDEFDKLAAPNSPTPTPPVVRAARQLPKPKEAPGTRRVSDPEPPADASPFGINLQGEALDPFDDAPGAAVAAPPSPRAPHHDSDFMFVNEEEPGVQRRHSFVTEPPGLRSSNVTDAAFAFAITQAKQGNTPKAQGDDPFEFF